MLNYQRVHNVNTCMWIFFCLRADILCRAVEEQRAAKLGTNEYFLTYFNYQLIVPVVIIRQHQHVPMPTVHAVTTVLKSQAYKISIISLGSTVKYNLILNTVKLLKFVSLIFTQLIGILWLMNNGSALSGPTLKASDMTEAHWGSPRYPEAVSKLPSVPGDQTEGKSSVTSCGMALLRTPSFKHFFTCQRSIGKPHRPIVHSSIWIYLDAFGGTILKKCRPERLVASAGNAPIQGSRPISRWHDRLWRYQNLCKWWFVIDCFFLEESESSLVQYNPYMYGHSHESSALDRAKVTAQYILNSMAQQDSQIEAQWATHLLG